MIDSLSLFTKYKDLKILLYSYYSLEYRMYLSMLYICIEIRRKRLMTIFH
jgi:hypothetical protein